MTSVSVGQQSALLIGRFLQELRGEVRKLLMLWLSVSVIFKNKAALDTQQGANLGLKCVRMRLAAGLRPDPLGELDRCRNVVPKYVLTVIYFRHALCFIFVYNCGLTVRNKRICYVNLCYPNPIPLTS